MKPSVLHKTIISLAVAACSNSVAEAETTCPRLDRSRLVRSMDKLPPALAEAIRRDVPEIKPSIEDKKCNLGDDVGSEGMGICFLHGAPAGTLWVTRYAVGGISVSGHIAVFRKGRDGWALIKDNEALTDCLGDRLRELRETPSH